MCKVYQSARNNEQIVALDDLNLDVHHGEFVSILGPSGCGKSTFLRIIAGLEQPSKGAAYLDGKVIQGPGPERGMCFQDYALFPWKTLWQNVEFGPRIRGVPKAERDQIVRTYINLMGLKGFENKYPHELSGGMQQRGALARLFANNPDVLLLDEPLAAVDAHTRKILQEELLGVWGREEGPARKTVLFVTHSIEEAVFLSDRIVIMSERPGRIRAVVSTDIPRPRIYKTRSTERYVQLSQEIEDMLRGDGLAKADNRRVGA